MRYVQAIFNIWTLESNTFVLVIGASK